MRILAFDIGGTRLKAGVVEQGAVGKVHVTDTPDRLSDAALAALVREAAEQVGWREGAQDGVGVCVPGIVRDGSVVSLPGKLTGLEGTDVRAAVRSVFEEPTVFQSIAIEKVVVHNDAIAHAVGESVAGAGAGCSSVLVTTIGTGVGTALVRNGIPSTTSIFGGFIPISERDDGPPDSIGRPDTIEALCRADRITAGRFTDPASVYEAFARGDEQARAAVEGYRRDLVRALAALANAHAPEMIVLGGGPMTPDNPITPGLEDEVNARTFGSDRVAIRVAELGDAAALAGLAHLVESGAS